LNKETKISGIAAAAGYLDGEINLQWEPVRGAECYIIQLYSCRKWKEIDIVTRAVYTVTGLRSGKEYSFRVAAVGSKGKGKWSGTVIKKST